jgi:uncharacterized membrane protein
VLDYLGNVILEKNSADLGVCYPFSVTFDSTGILWIGGSIAVDSDLMLTIFFSVFKRKVSSDKDIAQV